MSTQTDFRTLGRLGTATGTLAGGTLRRRSSLRGGGVRRGQSRLGMSMPSLRAVALAVLAILVALFVLGVAARSQLETPAPTASSQPTIDPVLEASLLSGGTMMAANGARTLIPGGGSAASVVEVPAAFAAVENLPLHLPSEAHQGVVFSEADAVDMLPLAPVGTLADNANPQGFEPTTTFEGPEYAVAEAITGVRPATGLAKVLLGPGQDLLSPVTGTVVAVDEYSTAEGGRDWRILVQPSTRPDLHVVIRRLATPSVAAGQQIGVGQTVLGTVRGDAAPVTEQNPLGLPSVWVSVRPGTSEEAVDPYAPAVTPTATTG